MDKRDIWKKTGSFNCSCFLWNHWCFITLASYKGFWRCFNLLFLLWRCGESICRFHGFQQENWKPVSKGFIVRSVMFRAFCESTWDCLTRYLKNKIPYKFLILCLRSMRVMIRTRISCTCVPISKRCLAMRSSWYCNKIDLMCGRWNAQGRISVQSKVSEIFLDSSLLFGFSSSICLSFESSSKTLRCMCVKVSGSRSPVHFLLVCHLVDLH